jgi:hypothetical protein
MSPVGRGSGRGSGLAALVSSLGAAGLFFTFWLLVGVPLPWSAGAGIAGYAALWMLFSGALKVGGAEDRPFVTDFVDTELARKTIAAGRAAAKDLRERIPELGRSNPLARRCARLAELLDAIASDVESDPKDAPAAQAFLGYQGEAASRLTRMAMELEKRGGSDAQIEDSRARIERIFGILESTMERQLSRLQEDNIAELQSELEVLEESLSEDSGFGAALLEKAPEPDALPEPASRTRRMSVGVDRGGKPI